MTSKAPTQDQLEALWLAATNWRDRVMPLSEESIWQVEAVNVSCLELAAAVCEVIGYAEDDGE